MTTSTTFSSNSQTSAEFQNSLFLSLMEEEDVKVIEILDSFWFFSNIFSSRKAQDLSFHVDHGQEVDSVRKLEALKPIAPILESAHQIQPLVDENLIIRSVACGSTEIAKQEQGAEGMVLKKSKKRVDKKIMDNYYGFDWEEFEMILEGYEMIIKNQNQGKMMLPSLNDGMAMKKHLKSWAYAVACHVR